MAQTKIFQVCKGYNVIASFDDMDQATKFFADVVRHGGRRLNKATGKGENNKTAFYWGGEVEYSIKVDDVDLYKNKKDAEFAVFDGEDTDSQEA